MVPAIPRERRRHRHGLVPRPEARLIALGNRVVRLARGLLASGGARLLTVRVGEGRPEVMPWDRRLTARPELVAVLAADPVTLGEMIRLEASAIALADALTARWPGYAYPEQLVIVTDGAGLAFSADNRLLFGSIGLLGPRRAETLGDVLAVDPEGAWALLSVAPPPVSTIQ